MLTARVFTTRFTFCARCSIHPCDHHNIVETPLITWISGHPQAGNRQGHAAWCIDRASGAEGNESSYIASLQNFFAISPLQATFSVEQTRTTKPSRILGRSPETTPNSGRCLYPDNSLPSKSSDDCNTRKPDNTIFVAPAKKAN